MSTSVEQPATQPPRPASQSPAPRVLRVAAVDPDPVAQSAYREALAPLGHTVVVFGTGRQFGEGCRSAPPDLVILAAELPGYGELLAEVCRGRPVPVVAVGSPGVSGGGDDPHVLAYLARPVRAADVAAAVATAARCFGKLAALREEAEELRRALEERKLVERAKGAVTRRCGVSEAEAYRRLRRLATDGGRRLPDVARRVLDAEDVFRALDELAAD